jgi:hypothetical protein
MKIIFYKSSLCPRCALVGLALRKIIKAHPAALELETVEVTTSPLRTWRDGIRMIPALRCGEQILAGFTLTKAAISAFLEKNQADS